MKDINYYSHTVASLMFVDSIIEEHRHTVVRVCGEPSEFHYTVSLVRKYAKNMERLDSHYKYLRHFIQIN